MATTGFVKAGFDLKLDSRPNLGVVAQTITDWNNALDNGWYMASAAANAPDGVNWFLGFVEAHGSTGYRTQTVHDFVNDTTAADQKLWRRRQAGGAWGGWIKLQWSQAEQDARYVQSSTALLQKFYESAQQTITNAGSLTLAHGLGVKPKNYFAVLQCTTADAGYSIGDEVLANPGGGTGNKGLSLVPDATNINVRFSSTAVDITAKGTGAGTTITNSSWRLVVRAWA
ncbi:pyocin knob domain-containing protein [Mesorhizobium sp. M0387]|uniref:pyocin knob domain-containing protein n=1 Tax=Mesorhizobium sp. M0387 TaxID=2956940 RepID=UPI0033367713